MEAVVKILLLNQDTNASIWDHKFGGANDIQDQIE